jgi:hypothetical protein
MRVESDKPTNNGGWLHASDGPVPPVRERPEPERTLDAERVWQRWFERTDAAQLNRFGEKLGVDTDCLRAIGCAWSSQAWAFPMRDASDKVIGIRLRDECGNKWAVTGSKAGLFIPREYSFLDDGSCYLVEGPTDLAAAMSLGLPAIGRPSCLGQEEMILATLQMRNVRRLVIVTDNDEPGIRGAVKLQKLMRVPTCLWIPPAKDMREYVNAGGNYHTVQSSLKDMAWVTRVN